MDSPVILDSATKFGRGIDLDREFPGFPFDDEGFGRRADIRSHLDDLAARHPEFADHLHGPLWGDVPFPAGGGSLHRNRNRRASTDRPGNNQQTDEDARSQTSGGSGVSSHGSEPDTNEQQQQPKSQGGLRNHTLDIGQHQHNMENPQQQRNVRSMSAPPENRNNQSNDHGNPRFVSRVDITPQSQEKQGGGQQSQPAQQQSEKQPKAQAQSQQQQQSQAGNVRHIPIFVEGRDEPVIPKGPASANSTTTTPNTNASADEPDFPRRQQSPPHFHRPSHFSQQHFNKHPPSGWPHFQRDPFFEHSTREWPSRHQSPFSSFRQPAQPDKPRSQQTHQQPEPPTQQRQRQKPQQQEPEVQPEAPPKPRQQVQPKDPLEKVALVQNEVNALAEQVRQYTGNSRQDKQYMYLDEMLTRELIKLDDIDTEGKENVRQARKQAIRSIQETISLLESKAPLPGQQQAQTEEQPAQQSADDKPAQNGVQEVKPAEAMDTTEAPVCEEQKAIPLPPPSSPTKVATAETKPDDNSASKIEEPQSQSNENKSESTESPQALPQAQAEVAAPQAADPSQEVQKDEKKKPAEEPMESSSDSPVSPPQPADQEKMEVRQSSPVKELPATDAVEPPKSEAEAPVQQEATADKPEEQKKEEKKKEEKKETAPEAKDTKTEKPKKEPPPVPAKPGKSPKKAKKTPKKQPEPVSETAIPMPAPGQ